MDMPDIKRASTQLLAIAAAGIVIALAAWFFTHSN
jgi:hypothetical protein